MSNQPKMIDANLVISEMQQRVHELLLSVKDSDYDVFPVINALENYIERLKSDKYVPDPISLPSIKPGDKVRHTAFGTKGKVAYIDEIGAFVHWETGQRSGYPFNHLEVIE